MAYLPYFLTEDLMQVKLKRDVFLDGTLYRCVPAPTTIPSEFRNRLPADAEVLITPVEVEYQSPQALRDFDTVRDAATAFDKKRQGK